MKTLTYLIPILLLSACGTMRETVAVQDDVYDIPDRKAMAAAASEQAAQQQAAKDDYYDPGESRKSGSAYRDYYDMTYNDPYYYNYGRFGFGSGIGNYGPGFGMGLSYGWPTTFGSMGFGYGIGYGGGYGYNPYWGNSWMSGYGYDPYGYYGYGNYGYGYGGYGSGYMYPYQGPGGGCYNCYEPTGYGSVVYSHRPSMTSGTSGNSFAPAPRRMRNPASLLPTEAPLQRTIQNEGRSVTGRPALENGRNSGARPGSITAPRSGSKWQTRSPESRPARNFDIGNGSSPSRSGGNTGGGGGRISSPRPR